MAQMVKVMGTTMQGRGFDPSRIRKKIEMK